MGEAESNKLQPDFNRSVKVEFDDQRITANAGVLLLREIDHRIGLTESIAKAMHDPRQQNLIRYKLSELIRERVYALAMGYSAQDDVDRLAHDPAFRMAVWDRPGDSVLDERLASQPTQSRLLQILSGDIHNLNALRDGLCESVHRHLRVTGKDQRVMRGTIDLDSFPIEVHGQQQGGNYNGHYQCTAYHPLVASFSVAGDYDSTRNGKRLGNGFIHAILRQGSVHTANGAKRFIRNVVEKSKELARVIDFRMDAGYTFGEIMDAMNDENLRFLGRLRSNAKLHELAAEHVVRRAGRPPREGYEYCVELGMYQADSWRHAQRLILVVVDRPDPQTGQLNLIPRYFFLVTNWPKLERNAEEVLAHYRPRGTFEDRLGEFNQAIGSHLSSAGFAENEATLLLAMLAFNLASMGRIELEDSVGGSWDLNRFQSTVLKAGAKVVKHSRRLIIRVSQSVQAFWQRLYDRVAKWNLPDRFGPLLGPQSRALVPPPQHSHLTAVLRS